MIVPAMLSALQYREVSDPPIRSEIYPARCLMWRAPCSETLVFPIVVLVFAQVVKIRHELHVVKDTAVSECLILIS